MDRQAAGWIDKRIDACTDGLTDGCDRWNTKIMMDGRLGGLMEECNNPWIERWKNEQMDEWAKEYFRCKVGLDKAMDWMHGSPAQSGCVDGLVNQWLNG